MKKLATIIAVALLATLALSATWWMKIRDGRAQVEQLQARVTALEAAPQPAPPVQPPPPVAAPVPAVKPVAVMPAKPTPAPATAQQPPAAKSMDNTVAAQAKQLLSGSAGRDLAHTMILRQYPDLGKELGLSEAQANNLIEVLARQQLDLGTDTIGMLGGEAMDPAAVQEMERRADEKTRANEAELASLLGSKYPDFQQYQATAAARQQVTLLQNALGSANALSEEQSKALLVALAAAQKQASAEQRNQPVMKGRTPPEILENQLKLAEDNAHRMLQAASPHLTFAQQEIYKNVLDQNMVMVRSIMQSMGSPAPQAGAR